MRADIDESGAKVAGCDRARGAGFCLHHPHAFRKTAVEFPVNPADRIRTRGLEGWIFKAFLQHALRGNMGDVLELEITFGGITGEVAVHGAFDVGRTGEMALDQMRVIAVGQAQYPRERAAGDRMGGLGQCARFPGEREDKLLQLCRSRG